MNIVPQAILRLPWQDAMSFSALKSVFKNNFYFNRHQPLIIPHSQRLFIKEWKFLQYELDCLQGLDWMKCPSCSISISQHSCHVDGNMKLYRFNTPGRFVFTVYRGVLVFGKRLQNTTRHPTQVPRIAGIDSASSTDPVVAQVAHYIPTTVNSKEPEPTHDCPHSEVIDTHDDVHGTQKVATRLLSLSSFSNLLECDSYLR